MLIDSPSSIQSANVLEGFRLTGLGFALAALLAAPAATARDPLTLFDVVRANHESVEVSLTELAGASLRNFLGKHSFYLAAYYCLKNDLGKVRCELLGSSDRVEVYDREIARPDSPPYVRVTRDNLVSARNRLRSAFQDDPQYDWISARIYSIKTFDFDHLVHTLRLRVEDLSEPIRRNRHDSRGNYKSEALTRTFRSSRDRYHPFLGHSADEILSGKVVFQFNRD